MLIHSPQELARLVYSARKSHKLSQSATGAKVGLKQTTLSLFETNPQKVQLNTLFRILSALDLELHVTPKNANNRPKLWKEQW